MEDFSGIIGILLVIGSAVVAIITKIKETKHRKDTPAALDSSISPDTASQRQSYATSEDKITDELTAFQQHVAIRRAQKFSAVKPQTHIQPHQHSPEVYTAQEQEYCIEDFDLRKAVIWSEILKAKYDNESH